MVAPALDFGGGRFLADPVRPPFTPPLASLRSSAPPLGCTSFRAFPSGLKKPQIPSLRAKTWMATLAALKIGRS